MFHCFRWFKRSIASLSKKLRPVPVVPEVPIVPVVQGVQPLPRFNRFNKTWNFQVEQARQEQSELYAGQFEAKNDALTRPVWVS
jgi:hypothetical protein